MNELPPVAQELNPRPGVRPPRQTLTLGLGGMSRAWPPHKRSCHAPPTQTTRIVLRVKGNRVTEVVAGTPSGGERLSGSYTSVQGFAARSSW